MAFENYFRTKGFTGWMAAPCSQCGKVHPSSCDVVGNPEFQQALAEHLSRPRVGDGTSEAALAIGEHAFRSGFRDGWAARGKFYYQPNINETESMGLREDKAWAAYDPPEDIKALS